MPAELQTQCVPTIVAGFSSDSHISMLVTLILQEWCHIESSEADLPATGIKIKQLENTIDELQSELEVKSREIEKLKNDKIALINMCSQLKKNRASNEDYLETFSQPSIRDDNLKVKEGPNEEDSLRLRDDNEAVTTITMKEKDNLKHKESSQFSKPNSLEDEKGLKEKDSDLRTQSTVPKSSDIASVSYLLWNTKFISL